MTEQQCHESCIWLYIGKVLPSWSPGAGWDAPRSDSGMIGCLLWGLSVGVSISSTGTRVFVHKRYQCRFPVSIIKVDFCCLGFCVLGCLMRCHPSKLLERWDFLHNLLLFPITEKPSKLCPGCLRADLPMGYETWSTCGSRVLLLCLMQSKTLKSVEDWERCCSHSLFVGGQLSLLYRAWWEPFGWRTLQIILLVHATFAGTSWIYLPSHVNHCLALCFINLQCCSALLRSVVTSWKALYEARKIFLIKHEEVFKMFIFAIYQSASECCFLKLQFWTS